MDHILVNIATLSLLFFVCRLEAVKHKKFCVHNPNNTLCVYPEVGPGELCSNYEERKLTNSEKRNIILWHADIRDREHNNQDVKLRGGVYWDEGLAAIARKWASQCRLSKDANRHFGNKSVEQNVFRVRDVENGSYTVADVLNLSEKDGRSYGDALKEWKIVLMGCGGSTFSPGKSNVRCIVLVCNYVKGDGSELLTSRDGAMKRERRLYVEGKGKGTEEKEEDEEDDDDDDDDDDDYDEYEDPFNVEEMKKEVEKKIDEEFGPFGRFLEPTERWIIPSSNLRQSGEIKEFKANKDYSPFEDAGASLRSKGKYELWSMRDYGLSLRPKFYTVLSSWGVIVIYHRLTGL